MQFFTNSQIPLVSGQFQVSQHCPAVPQLLSSVSRASSDLRPPHGPKFLSTRLWVSCLSSSHVRVGAIWAATEITARNTINTGIANWRKLNLRFNNCIGVRPDLRGRMAQLAVAGQGKKP